MEGSEEICGTKDGDNKEGCSSWDCVDPPTCSSLTTTLARENCAQEDDGTGCKRALSEAAAGAEDDQQEGGGTGACQVPRRVYCCFWKCCPTATFDSSWRISLQDFKRSRSHKTFSSRQI